jgi:hypothetical protein
MPLKCGNQKNQFELNSVNEIEFELTVNKKCVGLTKNKGRVPIKFILFKHPRKKNKLKICIFTGQVWAVNDRFVLFLKNV